MTRSLSFTIPGPSIPWKRTTTVGTQRKTPAKMRAHKKHVASCARVAVMRAQWAVVPAGVPLMLTAEFYRKRKVTATPDLSNLIKSPEDAMNAIVYADDSQVVIYGPTTGKYDTREVGGEERTVITVEVLE